MSNIVDCPNKETNKKRCPCQSRDCERNGFCCECVAYHKKAGNLPICLRGMGK